MERITKLQKKIIDAHLESAQRGTWNNEPATKEELINCLKHCGSTFFGH